ncbi:MAG: cysteine-rich CWC family protein [Pseudomonadota bacterium]
MTRSADPSLCPLCGESNACGVLQGQTECWCMALKIPEATLERIPTEAKNVACICARCAAASAPSPASVTPGKPG